MTPQIAALLGISALVLALIGYGAYEHMEVLKQENTIIEQKGTIKSLGSEIERQNESITDLKTASGAAQAEAKNLRDAARKAAARHDDERAALQKMLDAATPKKTDGTIVDCRDAWREIMKVVRP